jgi:hypothetical protein
LPAPNEHKNSASKEEGVSPRQIAVSADKVLALPISQHIIQYLHHNSFAEQPWHNGLPEYLQLAWQV